MRVLFGFLVLLAGIGAAAANLAGPWRHHTDMIPLSDDGGRVAGFSPMTTGTETPAPVARFETEMTVAAAEPDPAPAGPDASWDATTQAAGQAAGNVDQATRDSLARDIQTELARLGCYAGPVDGAWSPATQRAAGMFVTEANARIPVSQPDFALFSLAKSATAEQACGPAVTIAQAPVMAPPAMGLGGPGTTAPKAASYGNDRHVQSLFTNPLGN